MHSVDKVDVGVSGRAEHRLVPWSGAAIGMRCRIIGQVGLGFHDARDAELVVDPAHDEHPQQISGDVEGGSAVEGGLECLDVRYHWAPRS